MALNSGTYTANHTDWTDQRGEMSNLATHPTTLSTVKN